MVMRLSCNGCRVLRKGCSKDCTIRPCLQWIKSPEAQANATIFLAKVYGRAGLVNLIRAGPDHVRPAIFRSLLYEACGRIVNPIYGTVGLLWTNSWQHCQAAVEAVLKGEPLPQLPSTSLASSSSPLPVLKSCDIRHVPKGSRAARTTASILKAARARTRFKRSAAAKPADHAATGFGDLTSPGLCAIKFKSPRNGESASHARGLITARGTRHGDIREHVSKEEAEGKVELELTLAFEREAEASNSRRRGMRGGLGFAASQMDLSFRLHC